MSAIAHIINLPAAGPPVLALGAYLKNTICATKGDKAYVSHVHGDLGSPAAIAAFEASAAALIAELAVKPVVAAHDLHPDFHSTRFARCLDLPCLAVQHHHAHAAAICAENGHDGPVLGLSLDGFGLGPNHESWGGELLHCDGPRYDRLGHLAVLRQPGGDAAAREPWRMAAAALHKIGRGGEIAGRWPQFPAAAMLNIVLDKGLNSPFTSSAGRLFDAACGLLNIRPTADFEGQAPMELEALAKAPKALAQGWRLDDGVLDFTALLAALADCDDAGRGADLFHGTLIAGMTQWVEAAAVQSGCRTIALGGGCFFNKVLRNGLLHDLTVRGLTVLTAVAASPGDPGLSLGQAWIAARTEV